ncbi:MAG: nucleoside transporter C-terminal domain-containing protein [Acidobacteriota bacterium]
MEQVISGLGLLVLLGLAYVFSVNRKAVNFRTVALGIGLQLLLAVIILQKGQPSFIGMLILVFLVLLYIFETELLEKGLSAPARVATAAVATAALVGAGFSLAGPGVALAVVGLAVVFLVVNVKLRHPNLGRWAFMALLGFGLGHLWANGIDGREAFASLSDGVSTFLALSTDGAVFLFGNLASSEHFFPPPGESWSWPGFGFQFAFSVLPTIIFFSAFMAVMYYLGVIQVLVGALARFMHWSLQTSGSETLSCSANVFVGQTEAPFLIKPFLSEMTESELNAVMTGGFATIAGGVLAGYIGMGVNPGHLIAASVMSAPAALVIAKILHPETEESVTAGDVDIPDVKTADNVVEAAANGTTDGLGLALNVGAMIIAFVSLIACLDLGLGVLDGWIDGSLLGGTAPEGEEIPGFFPGSVATLFGSIFAPLAFIMGVPWVDAAAVGNLLGVKVAINEFVAYGFLAESIAAEELQPRSQIIATYALCGFANFSSIGIQIGGIGSLEPKLRPTLSKLAMRALFGGALASFTTATVAGILL